jgi:hypothetical protein
MPATFLESEAREAARAGPARREPKTMRADAAGSAALNFKESAIGDCSGGAAFSVVGDDDVVAGFAAGG